MKQIINQIQLVLFGAFCILSLYSFNNNCYFIWLNAYEAATQQYEYDVKRCEEVVYVPLISNEKALCLLEANAIYDSAINAAATDYENCLH